MNTEDANQHITNSNFSLKQHLLNDSLKKSIIDDDFKCAKKLIKQGATISVKEQNTLFLTALKHSELPMIQLLVENFSISNFSTSHLITAISYNSFNIVEYLIKKGAKLDKQNKIFMGTLHVFGYTSQPIAPIQFLVQHGADVTAKGSESLSFPSFYGNVPLVKYLIEQGADPYAHNGRAFLKACEGRHLKMIQYYILEHGFNPKAVLSLITEDFHHDIIDWCKAFADIKDIKDNLENTLDTPIKNVLKKSKI